MMVEHALLHLNIIHHIVNLQLQQVNMTNARDTAHIFYFGICTNA